MHIACSAVAHAQAKKTPVLRGRLLEVRLFFKIRHVFGDSECVWTTTLLAKRDWGESLVAYVGAQLRRDTQSKHETT